MIMYKFLGVMLFWLCAWPLSAQQTDMAKAERTLFDLINAYRKEKGKPLLQWQADIAAECREHSQNMASGRTDFGHDGFDDRVSRIKRRIAHSQSGENVAMNMGQDNPIRAALNQWKKSPGHNRNMLGNFTHAAIGIAVNQDEEWYFTQIFVTAPATQPAPRRGGR
jgi:uncharacterized protein YkwD